MKSTSKVKKPSAGTIELCFSREVRLLITNRGHPGDYKRKGTSDRVDSPTVPSPFSLGSLRGVDSPLSPGTDLAINRPMTRGKAIAHKVNLTRNFGSTNVVEMAKQWNIRIVHFEQMEKWVVDQLKKLPDLTKSKKKMISAHSDRRTKVKILKEPCIKFESTCGIYRPQKLEMDIFPCIDFKTRQGSCPFDVPKESKLKRRTYSSSPKKEHRVKKKLVTAGELRKLRERMKQGYCELCEEKYDNMRQHVRQENHKAFVSDDKNYAELDKLISLGPNIETLLSKHEILSTPTHTRPASCPRRSTRARSARRTNSVPSEVSSPRLQNIRRKLCPREVQVVVAKVESETDDGEKEEGKEEEFVPDPIVLVREGSQNEDEQTDLKKKYKKIDLEEKWSVISDRSMGKFLHMETESEDFEGFSDKYKAQDSFPSDVSYELVNEIIVSATSEVSVNKENGVSSPPDATEKGPRRSPRKLLQLSSLTPKRPTLMELMEQRLGDTSEVESLWRSPSAKCRTSPRKKRVKISVPKTDEEPCEDVFAFSASPIKSPKTPVKQIVPNCATPKNVTTVQEEGPWGEIRSPVAQQQQRKFFKTPESSRKSTYLTAHKPWVDDQS
ncbi:hypothetical protein CAPTEDRAFT_203404 [Capitella teleta]|uniref:DBF4-type domain-containing protein n=1 Tax=Capitella teleta TaxID=283909 RepID=R7VA15_CAPTE|nr:hypothetical protein CAPTEDRAFT_203404 [Capitella teleta]|eukprot:ELU15454.1 hypothetical protein CAPTEDRAFT_203404 [Capitella teleta]